VPPEVGGRGNVAEAYSDTGLEMQSMFVSSMVRRWLPVATIVVLAAAIGLGWAQEKKPVLPQPKDIVDVAKEIGNLKTFCRLVESAGLVETLKGKGPYTVFAPTDEAFRKLGKELDELYKPENKAKLQRILKNHVLEGRMSLAGLETAKTVKSLSGEDLKVTVTDGVVMVGGATVSKADVAASNGLMNVIDTVLVPVEKPAKQP